MRCSALGAIVRGSGIKRSDIVADGAPCVRYGELYTSYETTFTEALSHIPENLFDKCKIFFKGAVLFTLTGENKPDIGKALAYLGEQPIAAGGDLAFWEYHGLNPEFLVYSLNSPYAVGEKIKRATGDIIVHISGDKIGSILIGVPPLSEQQKIVEKIHELQPILSDYGITSSLLAKLDSGFPSSLKKSILQHALQGMLVPQDPNEEPASVLLERISIERAKMGKKAAKSMSRIERRDRGTYEIFPDGSEKDISGEIPFEIPNRWEWCRLCNILFSFSTGPFGSMVHKSDYIDSPNGIPLINPTNIKNGSIRAEGIPKVSVEKAAILENYKVRIGDIILARRGDLSKCAIITKTENLWLCGTGAFFIRLLFLDSEYFCLLYSSTYTQCVLHSESVGTTMINLNQKLLNNLLIPVPPIHEQHRIVEKLGVLMKEIGATK